MGLFILPIVSCTAIICSCFHAHRSSSAPHLKAFEETLLRLDYNFQILHLFKAAYIIIYAYGPFYHTYLFGIVSLYYFLGI